MHLTRRQSSKTPLMRDVSQISDQSRHDLLLPKQRLCQTSRVVPMIQLKPCQLVSTRVEMNFRSMHHAVQQSYSPCLKVLQRHELRILLGLFFCDFSSLARLVCDLVLAIFHSCISAVIYFIMKLHSLLVKGCFLFSFTRAQLHDAAKSAVRHHNTLLNL